MLDRLLKVKAEAQILTEEAVNSKKYLDLQKDYTNLVAIMNNPDAPIKQADQLVGAML